MGGNRKWWEEQEVVEGRGSNGREQEVVGGTGNGKKRMDRGEK